MDGSADLLRKGARQTGDNKWVNAEQVSSDLVHGRMGRQHKQWKKTCGSEPPSCSEAHAGAVGLVAKAAATGDRGLTDSPHH